MLAMHCQNGMHNAHVGHREWKISMVYPKKTELNFGEIQNQPNYISFGMCHIFSVNARK